MKEVNTEVPKKDLHSCPIKKEFLKIGGWMNEMGEENEGKRKFGVTGLSGESAIKRKGQNKNRKNTHSKDKIKLCHSKVKNGDCKLGSQCQDSHDIKVYMESKEPDIGPNCFLFDTFGFCKYGVTCRYANAHLSNMENVKNLEIFDEEQFGKEIKNAMKPGFQKSIRNKIKTKSEVVLAVTEFVEQKTKINSEKTDLLREIKALKESSDVENDELNKKKKRLESLEEELKEVKLTSREKVKLDFKGKTYLAPLTTVGNLPFRRICKEYGVDITCGEMALSQHLLQAQKHEWALAKRHKSETFFGLQICGNDALLLSKTCDLINDNLELDFVDLNLGCPIDSVVKSGAGSALLGKSSKLHTIIQSMQHTLDIPLTLKIRTGIFDNKRVAHKLVEQFKGLNISNVTLHGRSQQQRYSKLADWDYIKECQEVANNEFTFFGNGDCLSHEDYWKHINNGIDGVMIGRGALIKPWIFKEISERKVYDISSTERFEMIKKYANYGLEHWGSDTLGVNNTRRFLCEFLSHLYRYVPVGLLEVLPQKINERPPPFFGRDDLESLMASPNCSDWIKISEMVLGPAPDDFKFIPKHKSNAWEKSDAKE